MRAVWAKASLHLGNSEARCGTSSIPLPEPPSPGKDQRSFADTQPTSSHFAWIAPIFFAVLNVSGVATVVGYRGLIYADRDRKTVLRISTEADSPQDSPLQNVTHLLDYGHALIGREEFLCTFPANRLRMPEQTLARHKALRAG